MNKREVIELICEYGSGDKYIRAIEEEIAVFKEDIISLRELTAVQYSDMPKGNSNGDPTAKAAAYIVDVYEKRIKKLEAKVQQILKNKDTVEELLGRLNVNERKVIEARYIAGLKWDYIPGVVFLSRSTCFNCKKSAFKKMCR